MMFFLNVSPASNMASFWVSMLVFGGCRFHVVSLRCLWCMFCVLNITVKRWLKKKDIHHFSGPFNWWWRGYNMFMYRCFSYGIRLIQCWKIGSYMLEHDPGSWAGIRNMRIRILINHQVFFWFHGMWLQIVVPYGSKYLLRRYFTPQILP